MSSTQITETKTTTTFSSTTNSEHHISTEQSSYFKNQEELTQLNYNLTVSVAEAKAMAKSYEQSFLNALADVQKQTQLKYEAQKEVERLQNALNELAQSKDNMESSGSKCEIARLQQACTKAEKTNNALIHEIAETKNKTDKKFERLNSTIEELRNEIDHLNQIVSNSENVIAQLRHVETEDKATISRMEATIADLTSEIERLQLSLECSEKKKNELSESYKSLQTNDEKSKEKLLAKIAELNSTIDEMNDKVSQQKKSFTGHYEILMQTLGEIEPCEVNEVHSRCLIIDPNSSSGILEVEHLRNVIDGLNDQVKSLKQTADESKEMHNKAKYEYDSSKEQSQKEIQQLRKELEESKAREQSLSEQLSQTCKKVENLKKEQKADFAFVNHSSNNNDFNCRRFGLTMTLNGSDYKDGYRVDGKLSSSDISNDENEGQCNQSPRTLALTLISCEKSFLNPSGMKVDLRIPNIEKESSQQFVFGRDEWNNVIDSVQRKGIVWDVADHYNTNPPEGTPFYMFPFHGKHNQRFVFENGHIFSTQDSKVVTYVGGEVPFVMMKPRKEFEARQTFTIQLL